MYTVQNLVKTYMHRNTAVFALDHVSLRVRAGEFVSVVGRSGSGKTTLLLALGGLIRPNSGKILCGDKNITMLSRKNLASYRNQTVGFVLQTFNLVPYLTAFENILVPAIAGVNGKSASRERANRLLRDLGLESRSDFLPTELSVGQQQRVAIARALINDPAVILADEPTGNLDPSLSEEIMDILTTLNTNQGKTVIVVTHSETAARRANRILELHDGQLAVGKTHDLAPAVV